jgi:predicted transcriptional regulator
LLLLGVAALLLLTLGAFSLYYRRLRKLSEEYGKAKTLVEDIVVSFNKQAQKQEEKLATVAQNTMIAASRSSKVETKLEAQESQITQISTTVNELTSLKQEVPTKIAAMSEKITDITKSQEELQGKIKSLEERPQSPMLTEADIEAVIPIRQERALAPLTPTELSVLEILTNEGEKTAPEIKVKVNLTREHTARLMKKLYEEGYLERTVGKIPFAYRVKEEMRKILKRSEAKA